MKIRCPRCRKKLAVADKLAGKAIRCPACRYAITVPTAVAATGGTLGQTDLDLEGLAQLEVQTSEMSSLELGEAEELRQAEADAAAAADAADRSIRICPHCQTKAPASDPSVELLCSNCWKAIPALTEGGGLGGAKAARWRPPSATGSGGFYAELALSVTYPIPALSSLIGAAGVAFFAALVPVVVMTILGKLMQQSEVGTAQGVQEADLSGVQLFLVAIFAAEVFFFSAVAIHSFFDVVRTTSIRVDRPPDLSFSPNHWGKSFFSYLVLCVYYIVMTYLVAVLTIEEDLWGYLAKGDVNGLLQAGGTAFIVGMMIISFFIPMNLLGISLGNIGQALNPVNVVKSVARTHVHYVFLVLLLLVYGGMFSYAFSAILFEWFIPQIDLMIVGSIQGNIMKVAMPMLAWGTVMAFFFYGTYVLAQLHGLFARSFRKDLLFGTQ